MGPELSSSEKSKSGKTVVVVLLTVLTGLALISCGVALFVLPPAIQQMREAGRRRQAARNLQKIGQALKSYHQEYSGPVNTTKAFSEADIREIAIRLKDEWVEEQPNVKVRDATISNVDRTSGGWAVTFEGIAPGNASADASQDCLYIQIAPDGELICMGWELGDARPR